MSEKNSFGKVFLVESTNTPAWTAADKLRRAVDGEIVQLTGHEFSAVKEGKVKFSTKRKKGFNGSQRIAKIVSIE